MFDIGWTELLVIGVVALIVVGPKDLPVMFRTLGQFTAKARAMAREFQRAMDDAADSTGVKDVASDLRKMTSSKAMGLDEVDKLRNWDPTRPDPKDKPANGKAADVPSAEDEAAADEIDDIAAEMEAMRQSRARTAGTSSSPAKAASGSTQSAGAPVQSPAAATTETPESTRAKTAPTTSQTVSAKPRKPVRKTPPAGEKAPDA